MLKEIFKMNSNGQPLKQKFSKRKTIISIFILLLFVSIGVGYYLFSNPFEKVLAKVGKVKITQADLNEQIWAINFEGTKQHPATVGLKQQEDLLKMLIEFEVVNQITEKEILITQADFDKQLEKRLGKEKAISFDALEQEQKKIISKNITNYARIEKFKEKNFSWVSGDALIIRFDKYLFAPNTRQSQEVKDDYAKNKQNLTRDKEYALNFANQIYNDLKLGMTTVEDLKTQIIDDPIVGIAYFKPYTPTFSFSFSKEQFITHEALLGNDNVREMFLKSNVGANPPRAINISSSTEESAREGYYVVTNILEKNSGIFTDYQDWLTKEEKNLLEIYDQRFSDLQQKESLSFVSRAEAHSGSHDCSSTNHLGEKSMGAGEGGAFVVTTQYYTAGGSGPYPLNDINVYIENTGGNPGTRGLWEPWYSGGLQKSYNFTTGEAWSYSGETRYGPATSCRTAGVLAFGDGWHHYNTSVNGNFGNGWLASCNQNPYNIVVSNPAGGVGNWDSGSSRTGVNITNGETTYLTFTWRGSVPGTTYDVSTVASPSVGGTFSPISRTVNAGDSTSFSITANSGYTLSSVTDNCSATGTKIGTLSGNTYILTPARSCTVTANFTASNYIVSTRISPAGAGAFSPTSRTITPGNSTSFSITANSGYTLSSVTDNCSATGTKIGTLSGNTYTLTPARSCTVTGSFITASYTVSTYVNPVGGGVFNPSSRVVSGGGSTSFVITPATGYSLTSVTDNCSATGTKIGTLSGTTYAVSPVTRNCTVTANFVSKKVTCFLEVPSSPIAEKESTVTLEAPGTQITMENMTGHKVNWHIDWGDGSTVANMSTQNGTTTPATVSHVYNSSGAVIIQLIIDSVYDASNNLVNLNTIVFNSCPFSSSVTVIRSSEDDGGEVAP